MCPLRQSEYPGGGGGREGYYQSLILTRLLQQPKVMRASVSRREGSGGRREEGLLLTIRDHLIAEIDDEEDNPIAVLLRGNANEPQLIRDARGLLLKLCHLINHLLDVNSERWREGREGRGGMSVVLRYFVMRNLL
jgi:hypothetical protein